MESLKPNPTDEENRLVTQRPPSFLSRHVRPIQLRGRYRDICPVNKPDAVDLGYNTKPQTTLYSLVLIPTTTLLPSLLRGGKRSNRKRRKRYKYTQP